MKTIRTSLLALLVVLAACDNGMGPDSDDELVTVRYAISSTTDGKATVLFLDENEEISGSTRTIVEDGWTYTFEAQEGSQVLYLMTEKVIKGTVEAQIFVNDKLQTSHIHSAPTTTLTRKIASSAWGSNSNIDLFYNIDGAFIENISLSVPAGTEDISAPDQGHFNYCRIDRQLSINAGFNANVAISRNALDFIGCVQATISYKPMEKLEHPLLLAAVEQCDVSPLNVSVSIPVPGF